MATLDELKDDQKRLDALSKARWWKDYVDSYGNVHEKVTLYEWLGRLLQILHLDKLPIINRLVFQNFEYFSRNLTSASEAIKGSIRHLCIDALQSDAADRPEKLTKVLNLSILTATVFNNLVQVMNKEVSAVERYNAAVLIDVRKIVQDIRRDYPQVVIPSPPQSPVASVRSPESPRYGRFASTIQNQNGEEISVRRSERNRGVKVSYVE